MAAAVVFFFEEDERVEDIKASLVIVSTSFSPPRTNSMIFYVTSFDFVPNALAWEMVTVFPSFLSWLT